MADSDAAINARIRAAAGTTVTVVAEHPESHERINALIRAAARGEDVDDA